MIRAIKGGTRNLDFGSFSGEKELVHLLLNVICRDPFQRMVLG